MRNVAHAGRILACCLALAAACTAARDMMAAETGFVSRTFDDADGAHRYAVYVPKNYSADTKWPVVLYLHGAGFSGTDGQRQLAAGLAAVIRAEGDFPAIVVFPQSEDLDSPLLTRWLADSPDGQRALRILHSVEQEFSTDSSRRILAGWSMGGYGAWSLAAAGEWSAVVPVSGGGRPEIAALIKAPVWAIHGAIDRAIPSEQSRHMVDALNAAGGRAVLTEIPDVAHDAWRYAFSAPAMREWMLSPSPGTPDTTSFLQQASDFAEQGLADALDGEFKPVLTIPRAISIRMGGDALQTLAFGVPAAVDPSMLKGKIDDLRFDFTAAGEQFQITQSDLTFDVKLHRILIDTQSDGTLRLRVGLNPLTIAVGSTRIRGETRNADTGPFEIRLGPHYPLWIDLVVRPVVVDGRLRLRTRSIGFDIPDSNWVITSPENVTASGPDMTPDLVRTALVGGMYMRRARVEQCVRDFMPALVQKLEDRLQPTSVDRIVAGIWPLAVFRPRLRILPEEVAVDADGLTLVLGLAAATSLEAQRAATPVVTPPMGPRAVDVPRSRALEMAIAPGVLQQLSGMIVNTHAAHIDVRDMPQPEFALLSDRAELVRILPELARLGEAIEIRTELDLAAPLVVQRAEEVGKLQFTSTAVGTASTEVIAPSSHIVGAPVGAHFEIPKLVVAIKVRQPGGVPDWRQFAVFDVRLTTAAELKLTSEGVHHRTAQLSWCGAPAVEVMGGYVDAPAEWNNEVDRERLAQLVGSCWTAWSGTGTVMKQDIPDLVVGTGHLRIDSIEWRDTSLVATYHTPETRITNSGARLIDYCVRGPFSRWGKRHQLKPGETDVYTSASDLIVRRFPEPESKALTVTVGSELDLAATKP